MQLSTIREKFINYFVKQGHAPVSSSPVIPQDDPTLLFANAGMNQFKDIFLGKETRNYTRATTSQKCIRAGGKHNDLNDVGYTTRHLTFFEMLGNFSFGDYFKKEAIQFAYEVTTEVFEIDPTRVYATVFESDDEAFELWRPYLPESRIIRMGAESNFWAMGETGPCGPCSELLFDRGEHFSSAKHPLEDVTGERFLEFWNLVFMQFNRVDGKETTLAKQSIDTGMGLERIASLKQGVSTVFDIDLFQDLIVSIEEVLKQKYQKNKVAFHVIADHIRSLSFAIADGAILSNVERGYVLRKILRRAFQFGRRLGAEDPFLYKLVLPLTRLMGNPYEELNNRKNQIEEMIAVEEETFIKTLKRGQGLLQKTIDDAKNEGIISGVAAFKLRDTYGLPFDELELIAKDHGLSIDMRAYIEEEEKAKALSKKGQEVEKRFSSDLFIPFLDKHGPCQFFGYDTLELDVTVNGLLHDGLFVDTLKKGEKGILLLDRTPFYAEKGGQVGDIGMIGPFKVEMTTTLMKGVILHHGVALETITLSEVLQAKVDPQFRKGIEKNHTATHLLHYALQQVLGPNVRQQGSLVTQNRLRFDFNSSKALTKEELTQIERIVNQKIGENGAVKTYELPYEEAKKDSNIKQFFGDKYDSIVRVVQTGSYSYELCGGTHLPSTQELLLFRIQKESSIASGVRRIEALIGQEALQLMQNKEELLEKILTQLKSDEAKVLQTITTLQEEQKTLQKELKEVREKEKKELIERLSQKENIVIFEANFPLSDLADIAKRLVDRNIQIALLTHGHTFALATKTLSAKDLMQKMASIVGAKGGGNDRLVQGTVQQLQHLPTLETTFRSSLESLRL